MIYRNIKEETLSAAQIRSFINERICADVQNQIIKMEVVAVSDEWAYGPGGKAAPREDAHGQAAEEWVASLGLSNPGVQKTHNIPTIYWWFSALQGC